MISFYRHDFAANYDLLITYYPRFYREVREMVAILQAHGSIVDALQDSVERVYNDAFIDYMDENAISRLEEFLGMHAGSRSLDERRRVLKTYFAGFGKISASMLQEIIYAYTGADSTIIFEPFDDEGNNRLYIEIERGEYEEVAMGDILSLLAKKLPAHIYYEAMFKYDLPGIAIGGGKNHHTDTIFRYPLSGTIPDTALQGFLNEIAAVISRDTVNAMADYGKAEENGKVAGTEPIVVKNGVLQEIGTATEAKVAVGGIDYIFCGEEYASQG